LLLIFESFTAHHKAKDYLEKKKKKKSGSLRGGKSR
jgi:hypothetical protein